MKKLKVGILFGGRSAEHEVSLQSAKNIYEALDKGKYEVSLIGVDKEGRWYLNDSSHFLLNSSNPKLIALNKTTKNVAITPYKNEHQLVSLSDHERGGLDVVFPVLHGPYGEDGTIQGLLKLANIPFVGASVLGSAVGMDKDVMKRLLRDSNIPVAKFIVLHNSNVIPDLIGNPDSPENWGNDKNSTFQTIKQQLGLPFFIKPANLGSSVGVSKVRTESEFDKAIQKAFQFDHKILIEEAIEGRELECAVLGNEDPKASVAGEIIPTHEFYDYDAKYIDENGAKLIIPAKVTQRELADIQHLAVKAFKTLCCAGMARVDFFLSNKGKLYVNEINTIPGFTNISMYPKLWEASGIGYSELIDKLIQLALDRHKKDAALQSTRH